MNSLSTESAASQQPNDLFSSSVERVGVYRGFSRIATLFCDFEDMMYLKCSRVEVHNNQPVIKEDDVCILIAARMVGHDGLSRQHYGVKLINGNPFDVRRSNIEIVSVKQLKAAKS